MERPSNKLKKFWLMRARLLADKRVVSLAGRRAMLVSEWPQAEGEVSLAAEMVETPSAGSALVERLRANSIQKCHLLMSQFLKLTRKTLIYERCQSKSNINCIRQLRERTDSLRIITGCTSK